MDIKTLALQSLLLIILMYGYIIIIIKIDPRLEMKSYPKEIVDTVEKQTKKEKKIFFFTAMPVMLLIYSGFVVWNIVAYKNTDISFITIFLHCFIVFIISNIFDLLIMDWLMFCTITPKFIIMPGTDGNPGYKNYLYHFVGFIKGIVISVFSALVLSAIVFIFL